MGAHDAEYFLLRMETPKWGRSEVSRVEETDMKTDLETDMERVGRLINTKTQNSPKCLPFKKKPDTILWHSKFFQTTF